MSRTDPRRKEQIKRQEAAVRPPVPPAGKAADAPPEEGRRARRWGWSVAFVVWLMGFLFLAVMMLFDLIASFFR